MKKNLVNPTTLKGQDQMNRIHELMGKVSPLITESKSNSVLEISHKGPDGKIYGIVRENHEYYIKIAENKENINVNDFQYVGGLQNKKDFVYESYAKATKQLKLKIMSLSEAYNIENDEDTNVLLGEDIAGFSSMGSGFDSNVFEEKETEENSFIEEDLDSVGEEDSDIDNDGDSDSSDEYLKNRRENVSKAIQEKFNLTEEETSLFVDEMLNCVDETCDLKKKV